jgi:hypothetical protein
MIEEFDGGFGLVKGQQPEQCYGLKYVPSLPDVHFDKRAQQVFEDSFLQVRDTAEAICEIGVDAFSPEQLQRDFPNTTQEQARSSTMSLLDLKRKETIYLGIDCLDKSYLNDPSSNVHTIECDSMQQQAVFDAMNSLGIDEIDFLFIDGNHILAYVLNDWSYVKRLRVGGVVVMHDIHWHPGPALVFEAIDEAYFDKQTYLVDELNWGFGVARKIK